MPARRAAALFLLCAASAVAAPSVRVAPPAAAQASPSEAFGLAAEVTSSSPSTLTLTWTSPQLPQLAAVAGASARSPNLVLPAGALAPLAGQAVFFQLYAADASGAANSSVLVQVATPPYGGTLEVTPRVGYGLAQTFNLSAPGWQGGDADGNLTYTFYSTPPGSRYTTGGLLVPLTAALRTPFATVLLPAAKSLSDPLQLRVVVTNAHGATAVATITAEVTWPTFTTASQQVYISSLFVAQTQALIAANDTSSALALVGVLGTMLNAIAIAADGTSIDASGRATLRGTLIGLVADAGAAAAPSTAPACEATAAAVSLLVAEPGAVTANASATALGVLSGVAAAGVALSGDAATHTGDALSSLVTASELRGAAADAAVPAAVVGVLESVATSLQAGLPVPGLPPRTLASQRIALAAGFDTPAQAAARAFSAPGANASFDPLPLGALSSPAASIFLALDFDPHAADSSAGASARITRLAFSEPATGAPVAVAGLSAPITFTLDAPPALLAGGLAAAQCRWWDDAMGAYSGDLCIAMPNPAPPPSAAATLSWDAAARVASPAALALAWQVTGTLAAGCTSALVDCSAGAASPPTVVWELAGSTRAAPLVSCANATAPGLRVFAGASCALAQPGNAVGCWWDNALQAFTGPGCVVAPAVRCACTHLTDFQAEVAPVVRVASLSQLDALQPQSLIRSLRVLLIVVTVIFGLMHAGAAFGAAQERAARAALLQRLLSPEVGFVGDEKPSAADAVWAWRLEVAAPTREVGPLSGSAVALAAAIGMPFARLRCALPETLLPGAPAHLTGRRRGFSVTALRELRHLTVHELHAHDVAAAAKAVDDAAAVSPALLQSAPSARRADLLAVAAAADADAPDGAAADTGAESLGADVPDEAPGKPPAPAPSASVSLDETIASTALLFALLSTRRLLPRRELAARQLAASRHLTAAGASSGRFEALTGRFLVLLGPCNMRGGAWMAKARLWRAVLLAQEAKASGAVFWDASDALAFALQASTAAPAELPPPPPRGIAAAAARACFLPLLALLRCAPCGGTAASPLSNLMSDNSIVETADAGEPPVADVLERPTTADRSAAARAANVLERTNDARAAAVAAPAADVESGGDALWDCPLHFSGSAIDATMPPMLQAAVVGGAMTQPQALRVWATALTVATLRVLPYSWAASSSVHGPAITLPDAGAAWLAVQLTAAMPGDADAPRELMNAAAAQLADWRLAQARRVAAARAVQAASPAHAHAVRGRAAGAVARAAATTHETLSTFFAPQLSDGLSRPQRFFVLCTALLALLVVEVWLYYSRSLSCCLTVRAMLQCSADYTAPCRGFAGACAALPSAFADVAHGIPSAWNCNAFPSQNSLRDRLLAALIGVACSLPVKTLLETAFEASNERGDEELARRWLRWPPLWRLLWKRQRWEWHAAAAPPGRIERAAAHTAAAPPLLLPLQLAGAAAGHVAEHVAEHAAPLCRARRASRAAVTPNAAAQEVHDAAMAAASRGHALRFLGMTSLFAFWGVFCWLLFGYGSLLCTLADDDAARAFARTWATGVGFDQAYQWRHVLRQCAVALATLLALEAAAVGADEPWFEASLDLASVHATLLTGAAAPLWRRAATHLTFHAGVDERQ